MLPPRYSVVDNAALPGGFGAVVRVDDSFLDRRVMQSVRHRPHDRAQYRHWHDVQPSVASQPPRDRQSEHQGVREPDDEDRCDGEHAGGELMRTRPFAWWEATAHSFSAVIVGCLFAIVPLAVAFCGLESDIGWEPVGLATWIAIVAIVIALPVNLVYGLPAYATLRAWGRDNYMKGYWANRQLCQDRTGSRGAPSGARGLRTWAAGGLE